MQVQCNSSMHASRAGVPEKGDLKVRPAVDPETREGGELLMSGCDCHSWLACLDRNMLGQVCLFGEAMLSTAGATPSLMMIRWFPLRPAVTTRASGGCLLVTTTDDGDNQ